mgnify:FL=1
MVDSSKPLDKNDKEIIQMIKNKKSVVILNKTDLEQVVLKESLEEETGEKVIPISAKEGTGIDLLEQEIKSMFYHGDINFNDQVYITNVRHKTALKSALNSMEMVMESIENQMPEDFYL